MFDYNKYKYKIALNYFQKFSYKKINELLISFKNEENIYNSSQDKLNKHGVDEKITQSFYNFKTKFDWDKIKNQLIEENIKIISVEDETYPPLLKEIYDPPHILYYKGKIDDDNNINISVVGSRKFTNYGERIIEDVVGKLAQNGITIVSGLAIGIDALAHSVAVKNNSRTIAVLGGGINKKVLYPKSNHLLAEKIINSGGLIVSEFPLDTPPEKFNFPKRNRIVSGLSLGTLIVEAEKKSGTLITAKLALEQNREVFAVPGNIFSSTQAGTNELIKQGARPVTCAEDILENLNIPKIKFQNNIKKIVQTTVEEQIILNQINHEPIHIDEISRKCKISFPTVSSTLVILEMKGAVKNVGNMEYISLI